MRRCSIQCIQRSVCQNTGFWIHGFTVYRCVWRNITKLTCARRKGSKSAKVRLAGWKNQHVFKYHRRFLELSQIFSFLKLKKKYQSTFLIPKSAKQTHKIVSNFIETMLLTHSKKIKPKHSMHIRCSKHQNKIFLVLLYCLLRSLHSTKSKNGAKSFARKLCYW